MNVKTKKILVVGFVLITMINFAGLIGLYCKLSTVSNQLNTVEYTLFVGLNDKDTGKQEIPDDVAITTVKSTLKKYVDSYTLVNAQGDWIDESGHDINENTIVCYVSSVDETEIHNVADELIKALNQRTILIKKNLTCSEYYEGKPD